jgi:hypothetical protein
MIRALLALALTAVGPAQAALSAGEITNAEAMVEADAVHLRSLDNLNGTASDVDLRVGETVNVGQLEIRAEACRVPRDDPKGDAEAFLRIRDLRETAPRFSGWMFASSPALSALDHPRYDVWVVSCSIS